MSNKAFDVTKENVNGELYVNIYTKSCDHLSSGEWVGTVNEEYGTMETGLPGFGYTPAELRELADLVEQLLQNPQQLKRESVRHQKYRHASHAVEAKQFTGENDEEFRAWMPDANARIVTIHGSKLLLFSWLTVSVGNWVVVDKWLHLEEYSAARFELEFEPIKDYLEGE